MSAILTLCVITFAAILGTSFGDPDMLQDVCVADLSSDIKVNGFTCKKKITAEDFFFAGLNRPGPTNNRFGSVVTHADVEKIPGLNTLGISLSRADFAPGGLNPPHTHPRASEIVFVLEGELDVAFITTANNVISKKIKKGELFVIPKALIHFQKNNARFPASIISSFNSQLPGDQDIATTLFGANPPLPDDVLSQAFQIDTKEVDEIKSKFETKN